MWLERLVRKQEDEIFTGDITEKDNRLMAKARKKTPHRIWLCSDCGHLYFYAIVRCPLCESVKVGSQVYAGDVVL